MVHFVFFHYLPVSFLSFPGTTRQQSKKKTEKKTIKSLRKTPKNKSLKKEGRGKQAHAVIIRVESIAKTKTKGKPIASS